MRRRMLIVGLVLMAVSFGLAGYALAQEVGIAIGRYAEIAHSSADRAGEGIQVSGDRFGMYPSEARVHLAAYFLNFAAGPLKNAFDHPAPGPEHGVRNYALRVICDGVKIY